MITAPRQTLRHWPALAAWAAGWAAMLALDGSVDLANLAMLQVLASAVASLWWPVWASALAAAASVLAFNWTFVPPRGSFAVDLHQHALLLGAMLVVNAIVAALVGAQRAQATRARREARRAEELRRIGELLRDAADPLAHAGELHAALQALNGAPVALLVLKDALPPADDEAAVLPVGSADADQRAGLWHVLRQGQAMGPGTGRHTELADRYLPLRGRQACLGAAMLEGRDGARRDDDAFAHAQALADQMGLALQRARLARQARAADDAAQAQGVRNALLAAIAHDHRTPLATIMGAASSLAEQSDRLDPAQRRRLATTIVDEAAALGRLTDNTLQLARLDGPGVELRCDWESAEEIVGAALRRARRRPDGQRVRARLEPGLPLLWCDALLVAQLLDNLVDNALKYSPAEAPVEIVVRRTGEPVLLAVRDRGPGIAPAARERIFEVFRRGAAPMDAAQAVPGARGAGVGLAVCRAIARAHGGELRVRTRGHGGSAFEFSLPWREPPVVESPA